MSKRTLKQICEDGYKLSESLNYESNITKLAFESLKIGLQSYFATTKSIFPFEGKILSNTYKNSPKKFRMYNENYVINFYKTIIFLHHFIELILKDILRNDNYIFELKFDSESLRIIEKIAQNQTIEKNDFKNTSTIEFQKALDRIIHLIEFKLLKNKSFYFIIKFKEALKNLNELRNRLLHRGEFILSYLALDDLIAGHILPFINIVVNNELFKNELNWKYKKLKCGINPIEEILNEFKNDDINYYKIALYKEMARASYNNPLSTKEIIYYNSPDDIYEQNARSKITDEDGEESIFEIIQCPICGGNTFYKVESTENGGRRMQFYIKSVNCALCSFTVPDTFSEIIKEIDVFDKTMFEYTYEEY